MKKIIPVFLLVCFPFLKSFAQYHKMTGDTTKWCLAWSILTVRSDTRIFEQNSFEAKGDTSISSQTYKKVYTDLGDYYGGVREDSTGQKVYFIGDSHAAEQMIYDFSMDMGDTIVLDLDNNTSNNLHDGNYIVDSVATITIRGGTRKYIRLHNPLNTNTGGNGKPLKLEWIESVGEKHNPFYTVADDAFGFSMMSYWCNDYSPSLVMNHEINHTRNYVNVCAAQHVPGDIYSDTCHVSYFSSIKETYLSENVSVYPNPSDGQQISLEFTEGLHAAGTLEVNITDVYGRRVYTAAVNMTGNRININHLALSGGLYLLTVHEQDKIIASEKFVVK